MLLQGSISCAKNRAVTIHRTADSAGCILPHQRRHLRSLTTGALCAVEPTKIVSRRSKFPLWEYVAPASTTDIKRRQHMTWDHNKTIKTRPATSREECVVRHTHGSEWIRMRGIATRVVSPVSKLVNPQHVQPVHLKGHGPNEKKRQDHEEGRK
jgi:hypothetical protein